VDHYSGTPPSAPITPHYSDPDYRQVYLPLGMAVLLK